MSCAREVHSVSTRHPQRVEEHRRGAVGVLPLGSTQILTQRLDRHLSISRQRRDCQPHRALQQVEEGFVARHPTSARIALQAQAHIPAAVLGQVAAQHQQAQ